MPLHFVLNDREVRATVPPGMLVLDFLRRVQQLTGTKEGCREGDCGACVVLVGRLAGGTVRYKPVTSCLMPLGELHGKHLVTIEGLNLEDLTPPQQAIVDEGATQCGFCTPGIVVSLMGYLMERSGPIDEEGVKEALGGHLCRCTGYRSLKDTWHNLAATVGETAGVSGLVDAAMLPDYFEGVAALLQTIPPRVTSNGQLAEAVAIAGGTDLYVQRGDDLPDGQVSLLNSKDDLSDVRETDSHLDVGALITFEDFANHPAVIRLIPAIKEYMFQIASLQIRNRATLGGNIVNASPIGDITILLLALNSELVLRKGTSSRTVALARFYRGYKEMDLLPGEMVTRIRIPNPKAGTLINWEKVAKRKTLDIASVNSAIRVCVHQRPRLEPGVNVERAQSLMTDLAPTITSITIALGGVAPIPLNLRATADFLVGQEVSAETVLEAAAIAQEEIAPISDIRGSASYKRLLVRQLLIAHFTRLFPDTLSVQACYEKH